MDIMVSVLRIIFLFSSVFVVIAGLSQHVTLELLLENGAEASNSSWNGNEKMPNNLVFSIRRDNETAVLRLTKINPLETLACREDGNHPLNHTAEDESSYVDYSTKAVLLVKRVTASSTKYSLKGHLQIGLRLVHIEPTEDGVHEIIRQETLEQTFQDMQEEHNRHHRHKRSLKTYTVEVCLIADYQNFFNFSKKNNNDVAKTEAEMRNYFSFLAETMKVRYRHINEVEGTIAFNIVVSGLIIIENRQDSWYSEPFKKDYYVDSVLAINATQYWLESPPSGIVLPPSDHYMFFTGFNLHTDGNENNLGRAYTAAICIADSYVFRDTNIRLKGSTSIVEDTQGARTTLTAAHELGHALGARHDITVGCNDTNKYIMATSNGPAKEETLARHPWQFSTCSVRDIKAFVERDDVDCLNDNRYGDSVTTTDKAGQYYDKNTQCKMLLGDASVFCDSFYKDDKDLICYKALCRVATLPDGRFSCRIVTLMEYSTCDTNKWCYKGLCINANNSAPIFVKVPTTAIEVASNAQGVIYTAQTFDADNDTLTLHITYDPPIVSSYLTFNSIKKMFSVRQGSNLANLKLNNFSLIMSVDDGLLLSLPVNVDFVISGQSPSFTESAYNLTVSEGKAGVVVVTTLLNRVTDPDSIQFNFKLLDTTNSDYFTIVSSSGRITYAKDYDYDPNRLPNNVHLSVEVRDQTGLSASVDIFLIILNRDQPPVFKNLPRSVNLQENTAPGTLVFDVSAIDDDSTDTIIFSFSTTSTSSSFISTYLDINTSTGAIKLKAGSTLDYEQLTTKTFQVTIRISSAQVFRHATLTIIVTNKNEPPTFTKPNYKVTTNTGPTGQVIVGNLTEITSDPDFGDRIVRFGIEPGQYIYLFNIDPTSGRITFSREYGTDRSVFPSQVKLVVTATDTTGLKGTALITITVNISNRKPSLTNLPSTKSVPENTAGGTTIFQLSAQDLDGDTVTFSLKTSIPANQNLFVVSSGGAVRVRTGALIDFESLPNSMSLTITAFDGKVLSTPAILTLVISNVNEPPSFNETNIIFNVKEGLTNAILVSTLLPYVTDQDLIDSLTFAIIPSQYSNYFKIDQSSGRIAYAADYDTDPKRLPNMVVLSTRVTDKGGLEDTSNIRLNILNINQKPEFTNLPASRAIEADFTSGVFFTVSVTDKDSDDALTISAVPVTHFTFYQMDNTVRFLGRQGLPATQNFQLKFRVTDGQSSTSAILTVRVVVKLTSTSTEPPTITSTEQPTTKPTQQLTTKPTKQPSTRPTEKPTTKPTEQPMTGPAEHISSQSTHPMTKSAGQETTQSTEGQPTFQPSQLVNNWELWTIIIGIVIVATLLLIMLLVCRKAKKLKNTTVQPIS